MVDKIKEFIDGVRLEMKKVSVPEREALLNSSYVVCVVSALFTIYIFLADVGLSWAAGFLY